MTRSVSTELELDSGSYTVLIRITATRYQKRPTVEEVVRLNCRNRQEKLLQIGLSYDLAHAKGIIQETEDEKKVEAEKEAKKEEEAKSKAREEAKKKKYKDWTRDKKLIERNRRQKQRLEAHKRKKEVAEQEENAANGNPEQEKAGTRDGLKDVEGSLDAQKDGETPATDRPAEENRTPQEATESTSEDVNSPATSLKVEFNSRQARENDVTDAAKPRHVDMPEIGKPKVTTTAKDSETPKVDGLETKSQLALEGSQGQSQDGGGMTTQEKIEQFNSDPAFKNPSPPAVRVNGEEARDMVLPTPPSSPGFPSGRRSRPPRSEPSEPDTIVTYASSIDSDLDERYFDDDDGDGRFRDGSMIIAEGDSEADDEDLEEYSRDPWNAVCVVGLRLYTKEGEASVKVMRPPKGKDEEEKEEAPLDVDDPMKSMSDEPVTPSSPTKEAKARAPESIAERMAKQIPQPRSVEGKPDSAAGGE